MSYCQNCGAKIEVGINICPFCGQFFSKKEETSEKDLKIQELERKIENLEKKKSSPMGFANQNMKYFWIAASIMIIAFFSFIGFFVFMARR